MKNIFKRKLINNHTKSELRRHHAGRFVEHPELLPYGTNVSVFQKGTQGRSSNGDGWWERGEICHYRDTGQTEINVYDGSYALDEVEVYLMLYS